VRGGSNPKKPDENSPPRGGRKLRFNTGLREQERACSQKERGGNKDRRRGFCGSRSPTLGLQKKTRFGGEPENVKEEKKKKNNPRRKKVRGGGMQILGRNKPNPEKRPKNLKDPREKVSIKNSRNKNES